MTSNFKNFLMVGTALVAVSTFSAQANAATITANGGAEEHWASASAGAGDSSIVAEAVAGDDLVISVDDTTVTVMNDNNADDGSGDVNTFAVGDVTGTNKVTFATVTGVDATGDLTVTVGDINFSGADALSTISFDNESDDGFDNTTTVNSINTAGSVSVDNNTTVASADTTVTVTNNAVIGGDLYVLNDGVAVSEVFLNVKGNLTVTGDVKVVSDFGSANTADLITDVLVEGNATVGSLLVAVGGIGLDSDATFGIYGDLTATGGITLTSNTNADAILALYGTKAQTVKGVITGDGVIGLGNNAGVTFNSAVTANEIVVVDELAVGASFDAKATFKEDVIADVVFEDKGTITFEGDLTGSVDFDGVDDTVVILADGAGIDGNVATTAITSKGTLTIQGSSTITGTVGSVARALDTINAGANGKTVVFESAVVADTLNVTGTGTVEFDTTFQGDIAFAADGIVDITGAYTNLGDIDAASANIGTLIINDAASTVTDIGATYAIKKLTLNADLAATSVNAQAIDVKGNTLSVGTDFTLKNGQTLAVLATADQTSGDLDVTGDIDFESGSKLLVTANYAVDAGDFFDVAVASGTATSAATAVSNNPGITYESSIITTNTVRLTAVEKAASAWTEDEKAHQAAIDGGAAPIVALSTLINSASSVEERDRVIASSVPTVDGAATGAVIDVAVGNQGLADTRMASLRADNLNTGMAAGSRRMGDRKFWAQGTYSTADQGLRKGVAGYESDTLGFTMGVDSKNIINDGVLGVAVNYAKVDADSKNVNRTNTEVDSFGVTLYGSKNFSRDMFVEGQLGYAYNDIDSTRYDCSGIVGAICYGNTDGAQYSAKLAVGRDISAYKNMRLTPKASVSYVNVSNDAYRETATGGAAPLSVGDTDVEALDLGVNVAAVWDVQARDGMMQPSINIGYAYDAIGDAVEVNSTFVGGTTAFKTTGAEPSKSKVNMGVGFVYETNADWDVSAKYDAVLKDSYHSHNSTVRFTTRF